MSLSAVMLAHVVEARRLHGDLITAGQVNTEVLQGWDWFVWDFHPSISIGLALLTIGYFWLIGPARRRWNLGPAATRSEKTFFVISIVMLELSLDGPVHHLADNYLFSVHMFQHLIITLITPLLLLAGIPGWAWELILRVPLLGGLFRWAVQPVCAFLIYNGVLIAFHLPDAYGATMIDHDLHIFEHLLFMATAMLVWWPVLSRSHELPALSWGAQLIYLLAMSFPMKVLGAVITVKQEVLYTFYAAAPRVWGLTAGGDQRLGGLMMWLPAGLVLWFLAARAFTLWWQQDHRDRQKLSVVGVVLLFNLVGLACQPAQAPQAPAKPALKANQVAIVTAKKRYTVTLNLPNKISLSDMFKIGVEVRDAKGRSVNKAKVILNATMPEHGHGMMTEPKPASGMACDPTGACKATAGIFTLDGFRLHMPGSWLFTVSVTSDAGVDTGEQRYEF